AQIRLAPSDPPSNFPPTHNRIPLLYKPLGFRAEAPPHGQVTPTLPEGSWGQVYTFVLPVPKGAPLLHKPLGPRAEAPPHPQVASSLPEESWGQVYPFFFPPEGESWGRVYSFFFPEGESWGQMYTFLFPEGFPEGEPDGTRGRRLAPPRRAYLGRIPPPGGDP